jgi:hypothetical protein
LFSYYIQCTEVDKYGIHAVGALLALQKVLEKSVAEIGTLLDGTLCSPSSTGATNLLDNLTDDAGSKLERMVRIYH